MKRVCIDFLDVNLKSAFRNLKSAILLCALFLTLSIPVEAQQPGNVPRIGYLHFRAGPEAADEAFRQAMRDLGWIEGQNIIIEYTAGQNSWKTGDL